jgi:hypothetical protein
VLITLMAVILVMASSASPVPPGAPDIADGQYVLNSHGSLTPTSRQEYMHAFEAWQMGFTAMPWSSTWSLLSQR